MSGVLVITPTLARPEMCRRSTDSLLVQDFAAWRLVVAKNGGGEHLSAYEDAYEDLLAYPKITLRVYPKAGLGYALNSAFEEYGWAYDFFAVLEDDDEWHPDFLRAMYRQIRQSKADVIHCLQDQIPHTYQSAGGPAKLDVLRQANYINFPMCLFRADLWHRVGGFSEEVGPATDWDWHLRCLTAGAKYEFMARSLVTHHWHGSNYCQGINGVPLIKQRMKEGVYG